MSDTYVVAPSLSSPVLSEAQRYLALFYAETNAPTNPIDRWACIQSELETTGTYWQTRAEVEHGARVAWRNSNRCIGRLFWKCLVVRDERHLHSAEAIFASCVAHLRAATNGGKIRPHLTVFAPQQPGQPGIRIWNPQLIRYAGHRQADGSLLGDPAQETLTAALEARGWLAPSRSPFDLLPVVIQLPNQAPRCFTLPPDVVLEVPLHHPSYPWFAALGLKWHAVPMITNMRLEVGGISYPAAPFNGWYMGTEIGARNLGDRDRYNLLPRVARAMGLDTERPQSLWIDRALVELNVAVLHSFAVAGVTIVDHHTASEQFMRHLAREAREARPVTGQWSWLVPPMSGSTTEVFHRGYSNRVLHPNFFAQPNPWEEAGVAPP